MPITLVGSPTGFGFNNGAAPGHVIDLGSAPALGQLDVLCVNSDATVTTPAGFTALSSVGNQGAYIFHRKAVGGETQNVTIITGANVNCQVVHSRWLGVNVLDRASATQATGVATTTPAHSTGALVTVNELVVAFGAIHNYTTAPASPSWSAGFTPLLANTQGAGTTGATGLVAYRTDAGPGAQSPVVTWTNGALNRYMLTAAFIPVTGTSTATLSLVAPPAALDLSASSMSTVTLAVNAPPAVLSLAASSASTAALDLTAPPGVLDLAAVSAAVAQLNLVAPAGMLDLTAVSGDAPPVPPTVYSSTLMNFGPIVTGIAACACTALEAIDDPVCSCYPLSIGPLPWWSCRCSCPGGQRGGGQLGAWMVEAYPSRTFPQTAVFDPLFDRGCGPPYLVGSFMVEVARCVPTISSNATPPSPAEVTAAALRLHRDAGVMRQAIGCCLAAMVTAGQIRRYIIGATRSVPEQGGCAGMQIGVTVALGNCICP